jgi:hypothetical protein
LSQTFSTQAGKGTKGRMRQFYKISFSVECWRRLTGIYGVKRRDFGKAGKVSGVERVDALNAVHVHGGEDLQIEDVAAGFEQRARRCMPRRVGVQCVNENVCINQARLNGHRRRCRVGEEGLRRRDARVQSGQFGLEKVLYSNGTNRRWHYKTLKKPSTTPSGSGCPVTPCAGPQLSSIWAAGGRPMAEFYRRWTLQRKAHSLRVSLFAFCRVHLRFDVMPSHSCGPH